MKIARAVRKVRYNATSTTRRWRNGHLFRDFGEAMAVVTITETEVQVRSPQRAHNPLLIAAGFATTDATIPWLGGRRLRLVFG